MQWQKYITKERKSSQNSETNTEYLTRANGKCDNIWKHTARRYFQSSNLPGHCAQRQSASKCEEDYFLKKHSAGVQVAFRETRLEQIPSLLCRCNFRICLGRMLVANAKIKIQECRIREKPIKCYQVFWYACFLRLCLLIIFEIFCIQTRVSTP